MWFRRVKEQKLTPARRDAAGASPYRPPKGSIGVDGCLVCPACGAEFVHTPSEARRIMQDVNLQVIGCSRCGCFLSPP